MATFAAIRLASSRVSSLAAARPCWLFLEIDVGERVPARVADDEALSVELGVGFLDRPGRREAAGFCHEASLTCAAPAFVSY